MIVDLHLQGRMRGKPGVFTVHGDKARLHTHLHEHEDKQADHHRVIALSRHRHARGVTDRIQKQKPA